MFRHTDLENHPFFIKTISFRSGRDFWNSFLSGITKQKDVLDPLSQLHLRDGPRYFLASQTHGMMPREGAERHFDWKYRPLVPNPDPEERLLRPVIHAKPMYTPEQKELFSKPQSVTLIFVKENIRPQLFSSTLGTSYLSGVLIPANEHYTLINRIMRYDRGTRGRPYDLGLSRSMIFDSLEDMYGEPTLKGPAAKYTEILARLRWHAPDSVSPIEPALFIYMNSTDDISNTYWSIQTTLLRANDLRFALLRKFEKQGSIPLVVYYSGATDPSKILTGYFLFDSDTDPVERLKEILLSLHPSASFDEAFVREQFRNKIICFQQGLYQLLTSTTVLKPDFAEFLKEPMPPLPENTNVFYLETLRALTYALNKKFIKIEECHESYQKLLRPFCESSTEAEIEEKFSVYGFEGDFGPLAGIETSRKINARLLPLTHPFRKVSASFELIIAMTQDRDGDALALLDMPGIDVNVQDGNDQSALMWACGTGKNRIALKLLERPELNVNLKATKVSGNTALIVSCDTRNTEIALKLLERPEIDVNMQTTTGHTALLSACKNNLIEVVIKLMERPGIDINHQTRIRKTTALITACEENCTEIAMMLLERRDIDVSIINADSHTALYWVWKHSNIIVAKKLIPRRSTEILFSRNELNMLSDLFDKFEEPRCELCPSSAKPFTFFKRRHHCRWCAKAICGSHSEHVTMSLRVIGGSASVRLCTECELGQRIY